MKIIFAVANVALAISLAGGGPCASASDQPRAFDGKQLKSVHDRLLADYPVERKKLLNTIAPTLFYLKLANALEDAGVKELLDDSKARLVPPATRIAILNDYGFWLSKTNDPRNAVAMLQKVTELAPTRAVAQLNLGDAARSATPRAETWEQKNNFAAVGLQAYAAYRKLTGKEAPAAKAFQDLRAASSSAEDVCSYVAAFYNRNRPDDMWGYPDPVDIAGDGKLRHVYLFDEGTAHVPVIFASTNPVPEEDRVVESYNQPGEVDFDLTRDQSGAEENEGWPDEFHVLPHRSGYYLVYQKDGGPVAVVKPNAGTMCRFKRHFTPVLAEDRASAICALASAGFAFDKWPREKASGRVVSVTAAEELHLSPIDKSKADFEEYSDVKLDPLGASARIGYFDIASGAGRGCGESGIAFLDGQGLERSARAKAWIEIQAQMLSCHGSAAFPVRVNGENFIEIDDGEAIQRPQPPRRLLRLKGDRFETVCRVEQRPTYIPEPVVKPR